MVAQTNPFIFKMINLSVPGISRSVPEAVNKMIVDHAACLHKGIAGG